jgi:hypothetical protein
MIIATNGVSVPQVEHPELVGSRLCFCPSHAAVGDPIHQLERKSNFYNYLVYNKLRLISTKVVDFRALEPNTIRIDRRQ